MIVPILSYGAEIWGFQYFEVLENVQRRWCRLLLGVPKHTTTEAVIGECGRLPVYCITIKRCIAYWLKLLEMPSHRIPRQAYLMLCNLDSMGRNTWATSVKDILFSFGFGFAWVSKEVGNKNHFLHIFGNRVKDVYKQRWLEKVSLKPKLRTYIQFKS